MIWIPAFRFPAIVVLLIAAPYAALAEQPETVTRYFALAVSSENPAPVVDEPSASTVVWYIGVGVFSK